MTERELDNTTNVGLNLQTFARWFRLFPGLSITHIFLESENMPGFASRSLCQPRSGKMIDRVEVTGLRPPPLPHHRTCGFPHPAIEPGGVYPAKSDGIKKP